MYEYNEVYQYSQSLNVLYAEDDVNFLKENKIIFENFFSKVITASDGVEALEKYKTFKDETNNYFDLVITDINMPNKNGMELIKDIKQINKNQSILVVSAYSDSDRLIDMIQLGIDSFILKPMDMNQCLGSIMKVAKQISQEKENLQYKIFLEKKVKIQVHEILKHQKELENFKNDILTIFTHELKTPLNTVTSFSDYINRTAKKEITIKKQQKIEQLSSKISASSQMLLLMIENILEVGKIKSGNFKISKQNVNIHNLLLPTITTYKNVYDKEVIIDLDKNIYANIDPKILIIIFTNFYSNALKYSKTKILITLIQIDNKFELTVEDDGNGIDKDMREKIFNLFEQNDTAVLTREKEGVGVGLYIAKEFAKLCNFHIKVEQSELLGGAKFTLSLGD